MNIPYNCVLINLIAEVCKRWLPCLSSTGSANFYFIRATVSIVVAENITPTSSSIFVAFFAARSIFGHAVIRKAPRANFHISTAAPKAFATSVIEGFDVRPSTIAILFTIHRSSETLLASLPVSTAAPKTFATSEIIGVDLRPSTWAILFTIHLSCLTTICGVTNCEQHK